MSLKIVSYNCQSVNTNLDIIKLLLQNCDILLLQETLLTENNSNLLGGISQNFNYAYTPSVRKPGTFVGRSSGGLAILWKK